MTDKWISVDDRMPSAKDGMVLVYLTYSCNKNMRVGVAFRALEIGRGIKWHSYQSRDIKLVTHWMPLPQSPKEK